MAEQTDYVRAGDYLIPNLTEKDLMGEFPKGPLGKYGQMRLSHLLEHDGFQLMILRARGELCGHIREIQETASRRVERFMEDSLKLNPIPEEMKNSDPLGWAGRMENLKAQAEEIVTRELICTEPSPEQKRLDAQREYLDSIPETPPDPEMGLTEEDMRELKELSKLPF